MAQLKIDVGAIGKQRHRARHPEHVIRAAWRGRPVVNETGACMACGFERRLERAHVVSVQDGGTDDPSNIALLCNVCHRASERIDDLPAFISWAATWSFTDYVVARAALEGRAIPRAALEGAGGSHGTAYLEWWSDRVHDHGDQR